MRSILSLRIRRSEAASKSANFTVDEPPLIVRMTRVFAMSRPGGHGQFSLGLDGEQPVIFRQALGLANRSDFDLIAAPPDCQIGQPVVLGFAAAGGDGDLPAGVAREF